MRPKTFSNFSLNDENVFSADKLSRNITVKITATNKLNLTENKERTNDSKTYSLLHTTSHLL